MKQVADIYNFYKNMFHDNEKQVGNTADKGT